ncbi:MAG: GNAT family N-acetyltransferase [Devosia sp.]
MNTPVQKLYLGGPETEAKLFDRQSRYLTYHRPGDVEMLRVMIDGAVAGSAGYWQREAEGEAGYEIGWEILTALQGRRIGSAGTELLVARLRPVARHRFVYAYPTPENAGSNGICR